MSVTEYEYEQVPLSVYDDHPENRESARAAVLDAPSFITIAEFAAAVGVSGGTARNLLNDGKVPGARRKTPGLAKSTWVVPASAPARYLARFEG